MRDAGLRVIPVTFEDLVRYVLEGGNPTMQEVMHTLEYWGVPVRGNYRLYWPRDSLYIATDVSEAFCAIILRLLSDPRIATLPAAPVGAFATYSLPRREPSDRNASDGNLSAETVYVRDREVVLVFTSAGRFERSHEFNEAEPNATYHYIG